MRFNFRDKDGKLLTEVYVSDDKRTVHVKNHATWELDNAFGIKPVDEITWDDVYEFLQSRTYSHTRINLDEILESMGLEEYDPVEMCKFNQGRIASDSDYLEFL